MWNIPGPGTNLKDPLPNTGGFFSSLLNKNASEPAPVTPVAPAAPKLSVEQFGATVKQKYPAYAKYSDAEIGQKMLAKYPTYQNKIATTPEVQPQGFMQKLWNGAQQVGKFVRTDIGQKVGEQQKAGAEVIGGSVGAPNAPERFGAKDVTESLQKPSSPVDAAKKLVQGTKGAAEVMAGTASGALQATIFAPISGTLQALADLASDQKAVQEFAEDKGPILDKINELGDKFGAIAKAHPEQAQVLGDAFNIILGTIGVGKGVPAGATDIRGTTNAAASGLKKVLGNAVKTGQNAAETVGGAVEGVGAKTKAVGAKIGPMAATPATHGFAQLFGNGPEHIPFMIKNPDLFTPEAMKQASDYNLTRGVQRVIEEEKTNVPTPDQISEEVRGGLTRKVQALNEHAKLYSTLGNDSLPGAPRKAVVVDPEWLRNQIQRTGLTIDKDGRVSPPKGGGEGGAPLRLSASPDGYKAFQKIWDDWGPVFARGKMSPRQFLDFRQDLARAADYQGGMDSVLNQVAHGVRDNLNKEYRPQMDGLEKLDVDHAALEKDLQASLTGLGAVDETGIAPKIKLNEGAASNIMNAIKDTKGELGRRLENIAPGITKKVAENRAFLEKWAGIVDENGNLAENAINNIMNAVNKGRDLRLEKLEEAVPGITQRIKQIKAIQDINSAMGQKVGAYTRAVIEGGLLVTHPALGLAAIATLNPKVGLGILRKLGQWTGHSVEGALPKKIVPPSGGKGGSAPETEPLPKTPNGAPAVEAMPKKVSGEVNTQAVRASLGEALGLAKSRPKDEGGGPKTAGPSTGENGITKAELRQFVRNIDAVLNGKINSAVIAKDRGLIVKLATLSEGNDKFGLAHILKHVEEGNISTQDVRRLAELISTATLRTVKGGKVYYGKPENPLMKNLVAIVGDNPDIANVISTFRKNKPESFNKIFEP